MLKADGFDDCVVGIIRRCGSEDIICYDEELVIKELINRDGMDYEEAREYYDFNIVGAYMGEGTPCFLTRATLEEIENELV